ncbi:3-oxoadipate enol-lactonase [Neisseriaceae bacterium JH1-16]|nr:3-oxoadipate enol-lactonase [Neisseriaceae bacterium JH1-16]
MAFITTPDGIRLHYQIDGPAGAPVLVLSNSLGTTLDMWAPQLAAFGQHYRVLRYDTRGHGGSDAPAGPYRFEQLGRDVLALLDALDIERAHFCGISMGGLTGLWLGVNAGHRLDKLVVCNSAAKIGNAEGWHERAALVRKEGMAGVAAGAAGRWFTPAFAASSLLQVLTLVEGLATSPAEGYAACCDALADSDLREAIFGIVRPTLLVAGSADPVTTVDDARFIAERIAGSRVVELPASHLSNVEAVGGFNEAVLAFLAN